MSDYDGYYEYRKDPFISVFYEISLNCFLIFLLLSLLFCVLKHKTWEGFILLETGFAFLSLGFFYYWLAYTIMLKVGKKDESLHQMSLAACVIGIGVSFLGFLIISEGKYYLWFSDKMIDTFTYLAIFEAFFKWGIPFLIVSSLYVGLRDAAIMREYNRLIDKLEKPVDIDNTIKK
jgi:hypothetical protein